MNDLIGSGKIICLIQFSSSYFYNPYSYVRKLGSLVPVVEKKYPFILVPSGGWSRSLVRLAKKPAPTVLAAVQTSNKPIQSLKKLAYGYCVDTSLMLIEGDSDSLTNAFTYAPIKII